MDFIPEESDAVNVAAKMQVSDLHPNVLHELQLERVRVMEVLCTVSGPSGRKDGSWIHNTDLLVGDRTGCVAVNVSARGEKRFRPVFEKGQWLYIPTARVVMFGGFLRLEAEEVEAIEAPGSTDEANVNERNNISASAYEFVLVDK